MKATPSMFLLVLVSAGLFGGCIDLKPREDDTRFYVLQRVEASQPVVQPAGPDSTLVLGIRRVELASYLDTPRMVVRIGPQEVRFENDHRWGEDLEHAIGHLLAHYLMRQTQVGTVVVAPWSFELSPDYVVDLYISRFEGDQGPGGPAASLQANWQIRDAGTGRLRASNETRFREDTWNGFDYAALAGALSTGLNVLAVEIAAAL